MLRVLLGDGARHAGARLRGLNGRAHLLDERSALAEALAFEIAQDEMEIGRCGTATHLVNVDEPLPPRGCLRRERHVGQRLNDLGGQMKGVDQFPLGLAGMDRDALHVHVGLIGRKRLVDDLAPLGPVQRVPNIGLQVACQPGVDAAPDFFIRGKSNSDRAVREVGMSQEVSRGGHDDGHARLVVRSEQRRPAGSDDVFANLRGQVRKRLR